MNFDNVTNRQGTDCLKYDAAVRRNKPANILPFWVADMLPYIREIISNSII